MDYLKMTHLERLQDVITRTEQLLKESKVLHPRRREEIETRLISTKAMAMVDPSPSNEVIDKQLHRMWEVIAMPLMRVKLHPNQQRK